MLLKKKKVFIKKKSTLSALISKFLKNGYKELVLALAFLSTKKKYLPFKLFPHQIGPNWANQLGETTVLKG